MRCSRLVLFHLLSQNTQSIELPSRDTSLFREFCALLTDLTYRTLIRFMILPQIITIINIVWQQTGLLLNVIKQMIVAEQGDILAGEYKIVCPHILMNNNTHKLYKSTNFKPWTVFPCKDYLESAKVVTLTEYDPIFLVLKEAQTILALGDNKLKELDELFSVDIVKYYKEKAQSICETMKVAGDDYYKVSEAKILDLLERRYNTFVQKLSVSEIKLKVSKFIKEGDLQPAKVFAIQIMRKDVHNDFMNKLVKDRLKIMMPLSNPVVLDVYEEKGENQRYVDNYSNEQFKRVSSSTPKISAKDEKLKKSAGGTLSITGFFKKKTETVPQVILVVEEKKDQA